MALTTN